MSGQDQSRTTGKPRRNAGIKVITQNRRALFHYFVEQRYEAGLQLLGTEVKSLRDGTVNLSDSYAAPQRGELFLLNCNIGPYAAGGQALNHVALRPRKLLLHKREVEALMAKTTQEGYTLIPLSLYFKDGRAKAEIGVCRGKEYGDKRHAIAEREQRREMDRAIRGARKRRS
jgi:SsrA-binding protein